ncbi:transcription factor stalky-like [Trichoplusia ni]|uniref:Transcription factor stalky-like n=1 Tax=Trichoplusia ni TaxID=7111 RepID=A0A7E5VME2_TRINI|nr:transcription factor stalky-like [Trichoplusia ni]
MTDSDSDASNSVFTFQNVNTTVSAKGPNTNITNLSFRNQLTSTMCMPRNFERQRYAESVCDQRSMYYRRETSPMSIHSACDIRPRNFQQYYGGMGSQQSAFNGRSGSPMSVRSIDSTASVSAADIAFAFKNVKFNKYDLKVIKDAYHRLMKQRVRKRIEKRRNMRLFLKGNRRRSGYDSGEQGSNSSISSDDCGSIKTYKENMSTTRSTGMLTEFRKPAADNMFKDFSTNVRQNNFKNMFSVGSTSNTNTQNYSTSGKSKQNNHMPTQKERFKNGFLLPSQRFNRSVASTAIPETSEKPQRSTDENVKNHFAQNKQKNKNVTSGSEDEQIFSETVRESSTYNYEPLGKRTLDSDDESNLPDKKKSKLSSPRNAQRNNIVLAKPKNANPLPNTSNFEFAVPSLPVRKSRPKVQEQLIAKSAQPLTGFLEPVVNKVQDSTEIPHPYNIEEKSSNHQSELSETTQNSDVSMRPSFIKRKLFTQKLDVAEKANLSDGTSSPHSNVYTLQKEKNKARKLVTNQSCLNRDVQDDNNLLDLIHKIVPAERMNITNQSTISQNKTDVKNKNKKDNDDKWDVTSVISMCNEDDVSDTYTDEEIFEQDVTKISKNNKDKEHEKNNHANMKPSEPKVPYTNQLPRDCKIVLQKLENNNSIQNIIKNNNFNLTHNNVTKSNVKSSVKSFWDTDFESDAECHSSAPRRVVLDNLKKVNSTLEPTKQDSNKSAGYDKNHVSKMSLPTAEDSNKLNNTTMNNTLDSTRKFNASTLSIRSHRITTKKKCCNETCVGDATINRDSKKKVAEQKAVKSDEPKKISVVKQAKTVKKVPEKSKSKPDSQNEPKQRSTSNARNKNINEIKSQTAKQIESPKNIDKPRSKTAKPNEKANESVNKTMKSKPEKQKKLPVTKSKEDAQTAKRNLKSHAGKENKKDTPTKKSIAKKVDKNGSMVSNQKAVSKTKSKLNNTMEPAKQLNISNRPIRSCRASSQNRSQDISSMSLNTSDVHKSLRSRIINLSSSIENITIKIKPSAKKVNQSISQIKTRKSNISFSLADKMTPTPKKNLPRNRADFFKGKRKA